MDATIDKEQLRNVLNTLVVQEPDFVAQLMSDINDALQQTKRQRLEQIVNEDFTEYEAVFRKLA